MAQKQFVHEGKLSFICTHTDCDASLTLGKVMFHFARMKLAVHQNTGINFPMTGFGFDQATVDQFKARFILIYMLELVILIMYQYKSKKEKLRRAKRTILVFCTLHCYG